nr:MAG TPA: hypothetical protein [Caudoviricetes sp.]
MKKWYNVELFDSKEIDLLKAFLRGINVNFETSGCGNGSHFEIEVSEDEAVKINNYLEVM